MSNEKKTSLPDKKLEMIKLPEDETTEIYHNLFKFMDNGLAVYEVELTPVGKPANARLVEANPAFAEIMGLSLNKVIGKDISDFFPDAEMVKEFEKTASLVLKGKIFHKEHFCKTLNKYFDIHSFSSEPNHIATLIQDITEDKKEVIKYRRHMASIVEDSDNAIFSVTTQGKILSWNKGAEEMYGYTSHEASGKKADDLVAYPDKEEFILLRNMVLKGEKVKGFQTLHRNKNGAPIPVAITKSVIRDDNDKIVAISNIVQDISLIKEREKELIKARKETERAARAKAAFLSNMSHEIRTPLNSILGFTGILQNLVKDEEQRKILKTIAGSGNQLLNLINDIIDVSRIEAGELQISIENVVLNELMENVHEQCKGAVSVQKKQHVNFQLHHPEEILVIQTDPYRLQQVLHNLLSNAFRFTEHGKVEFGYEISNGKEILFYVKDTGTGIREKNKELIFERFRQGENISGNLAKGTGLGLTICKGILENLGGKIWYDSEPGKGTSMYSTIPYVKGFLQANDNSLKMENQIPDLSGKTILIVEDDAFSLEILKHLVEMTNAAFLVAEDGETATELFQNNKVDAVLLDIRLPKKNGYEVLKTIRETHPDIPVIAETAHAMRDEVLNFSAVGFTDYLVKPINQMELYHILRKYLIF